MGVVHGLVVALVLGAAGQAVAFHYPAVRKGAQRKDQTVLDGLRRLTYAESMSITIDAFLCDCLEPTCDGAFMVGCGGEVLPFNGGSLSAARRTSRQTCLVCGCAGFAPIELRATPVCASF